MPEREAAPETTSRVELLAEELEQWRVRHGGRGRRIPEELWAQATKIAEEVGIESAARRLRLDRERLGDRVAEARSDRSGEKKGEFVEVELPGGSRSGRTMVRLVGRDGEELHIIGTPGEVDVQALARGFWGRH